MNTRLTVEDIAAAMFISKYHFIHIFTEIMGVSPYSYLLNMRVNKVKQMLVTTDEGLSAIAERTGFCDGKNMIRAFKKQTGQTPGQVRRANFIPQMQGRQD